MPEINWKSKYTELKAKYMSDVDTAYRLGIEQGAVMAQQQQMQEQQAQEQAMAEQQAQGQPGQEGAPQEGGEQAPASEHPQGSELDQHIATLEGMMGKAELTPEDLKTMKKSFDDLKFGIEMKKSDRAVKSIAKSLKSPVKAPMRKSAESNLSDKQKSALSMQEKIVSDIMSQWDQQETNLTKSISDIIAGAGLKKD